MQLGAMARVNVRVRVNIRVKIFAYYLSVFRMASIGAPIHCDPKGHTFITANRVRSVI